MILRTGYTTGACAAAAAKAATLLLCGEASADSVEIGLPEGLRVRFPLVTARQAGPVAEAAVRKDAGDDPDITDQVIVAATVAFADESGIRFEAGEGVGIVTKPGLSIPPGEPAINPGPRAMIRTAVREVTSRGLVVTVSIPGGRELALKTFNPRLGVEGGLSVIGTTGIVKPFSAPALKASLKIALDVAAATGVRAPVLVPGNIGERAALRHLGCGPDSIVQVSNHWGFMLDEAARMPFERMLIMGHPGKLAKLADGEWDTHSSTSASAAESVNRLASSVLRHAVAKSATVEGIFTALSPAEGARVGEALSIAIRHKILERIGPTRAVAVVLINMAGEILGSTGDLSPWK